MTVTVFETWLWRVVLFPFGHVTITRNNSKVQCASTDESCLWQCAYIDPTVHTIRHHSAGDSFG